MNIKSFEVDWDNYAEMAKLGNQIKGRLSQLNPNRISKKEMNRRKFHAAYRIYETDISKLYDDLELDISNTYYVYAHTNPLRKIAVEYNWSTTFAATLGMTYFPFYIGKGNGNRSDKLSRNETHRKIRQWIKESDKDILPIIIKNNLTEKDALMIEAKLIDIFGLKIYGGYLTNLDEGYKTEERRRYYSNDLRLIANDFR